MQKRSWSPRLGALALAGLFALTACGGASSGSGGGGTPTEIKVGAVIPLSGALAQQGTDLKAAMELAAEVVNGEHPELKDVPFAQGKGLPGKNGAKIKLVFADHQGDPNTGRAETERLITQEKVAIVTGAYSSAVTNTASQAAERAQVPFISGTSSSPTLTERGYKYFYRNWPSDTIFIGGMFEYLKDVAKDNNYVFKTGVIITEDTLWGQDSAKLFKQFAEEQNIKILNQISYKNNASSVDSEVSAMKAANPDLVMGAAYTSDAILIVKTMQKLNFRPKFFLGNDTGYDHPDLLKNTGNFATGIASRTVSNPDLLDKKASMKAVMDLFQKKTGRPMPDTALGDFQCMMVIADALNRAKDLTPAAINTALRETNIPAKDLVIPGWGGVKFDEKGQNVLVKPIVVQAQGDKFVSVWPAEFAMGKTVFPMNK